jgi:hypothetical protein
MERGLEGGKARDEGGYRSSDELLADLRGANGDEARAVATGYMMAIRDADADCMQATTLRQYLRGDSGGAMALAGMGYVMAVRDCMAPAANPGAAGSAAAGRMRRDAARVRAWLERQPLGVIQPAIASVHIALATAPAPAQAPASPRSGVAGLRDGFLAQSPLAKGAAALAAGLALALGLQLVPVAGPDRRLAVEHDVELSRHAADLTAMLLEQRRYEKDSIINVTDAPRSEAYARKWDEARVALGKTIDTLGRYDLDAADRQSLQEIRQDFNQYEQGYLQLLAQMQSGRVRTPQDANRVLASYKSAAHRIEQNGFEIAARALRRLNTR